MPNTEHAGHRVIKNGPLILEHLLIRHGQHGTILWEQSDGLGRTMIHVQFDEGPTVDVFATEIEDEH